LELLQVDQKLAEWRVFNQSSVRQMDTITAPTPTKSSATPAASMHMSESVRKRLNFIQSYSNGDVASHMKPSTAPKHYAQPPNIQEKNMGAQILDKLFSMLTHDVAKFSVITTNKPKQRNANIVDPMFNVPDSEVRVMGVRIVAAPPSSPSPVFCKISKGVNLCHNLAHNTTHTRTSDIPRHVIIGCCNTVMQRCTFTRDSVGTATIPPRKVFTFIGATTEGEAGTERRAKNDVNITKVSAVDICDTLPVSFSATFKMDSYNIDMVKKASAYAANDRHLQVFKCNVCDGSTPANAAAPTHAQCVGNDTVVLTPRHVGGKLLYTSSLFCSMGDLAQVKDTHTLCSMPAQCKHPRFGIDLAEHMDIHTARVYDQAVRCVDSWMNSLCGSDHELRQLLDANKHTPVPKLDNTRHCVYMSPKDGITMHIQNNVFSCDTGALLRYGLDMEDEAKKFEVNSVLIFFHGPTIHK
jgi:hypothetical protein